MYNDYMNYIHLYEKSLKAVPTRHTKKDVNFIYLKCMNGEILLSILLYIGYISVEIFRK